MGKSQMKKKRKSYQASEWKTNVTMFGNTNGILSSVVDKLLHMGNTSKSKAPFWLKHD